MQKETFEQIMIILRDKLAILNITLCRECLLPIKMDEREYFDKFQAQYPIDIC
ncbi:8091_t:CDS:2 [Funneliformis geosporum]|nr:8091_t:CDS:2 [Funneliformis geosporum]